MKKKWPSKQWVLGHRGARSAAPENTLSAFKLAMKQGADGVELDVFFSKDGIPVVIHDENVERTTTAHGFVHDFTAVELSQLNASKNNPDFPKEGVPSLLQVFKVMPAGSIVNVELKGSGYFAKKDFVLKLIEVFGFFKAKLCLIVSSADEDLLSIFQRHTSDYLVSLILKSENKDWNQIVETMDRVKPDALHVPPDLYEHLREDLKSQPELKVAVWTVNEPNVVKSLFEQGVAGIFTDEVSAVVKSL